jgi:hypothetical protein
MKRRFNVTTLIFAFVLSSFTFLSWSQEEDGFRLAPEALKNFEVKTKKLSTAGPWSLPQKAQLFSGEEVNLYRLRNGFFKRIDFNLIRHDNGTISVNSPDLKVGDEIAVHGIGFLRMAELAAFGGTPEGHSH